MPYINVDEVYILDNTGLQVDQVVDIPYTDAALTDGQKEQARKNIAAGGTNPNLLDNPFFTVNQRSASGTVTQPNYGVDRWRVNGTTGATISFATGQVTLPASGTELLQILPIEAVEMGSTVTLSVKLADGTIVSGTATIASSYSANTYVINTTVDGVRLRFTYRTNGVWHINFAATDSTDHIITAAKLEKGSVSTLANDAPPNYAEELAKCQYYFKRFSPTAYTALWSGVAVNTTTAAVFVDGEMRTGATPTVSISGTGYIVEGTSLKAITSGSAYYTKQGTRLLLVTSSSLTTNNAINIYTSTSQNFVVDLSADL